MKEWYPELNNLQNDEYGSEETARNLFFHLVKRYHDWQYEIEESQRCDGGAGHDYDLDIVQQMELDEYLAKFNFYKKNRSILKVDEIVYLF